MSRGLVRAAGAHAVLPPRYMGTAAYYAVMGAYGRVTVDASLRYDKRAKSLHRCDIVDTRGRLTLTVPVSVPHGEGEGPMRWNRVRISRHGEWWRLHRTALESAYGRTPYFEFLIDKFDAVLADPGEGPAAPTVIDLDRRADEVIRGILGFENVVEWAPAPVSAADGVVDLRRCAFDDPQPEPYRQVRADRLGFVGNLSILDLIFNLGPESVFYLRDLQGRLSCLEGQ